ncbi:MAG: glycosyl hydrolase [Microbacterium sp.]|uniref:glycosyl hydrolase n=1 Tax=Microbacterium sp. TaxID=51671 RepID=UPI0039E57A55
MTNYGTPRAIRVFFGGLPDWQEISTRKGTDLVVSFKIDPKSVLTGRHDAALRAWFGNAPRDVQVFWTYFHEPEDEIERGAFSADEFRRAWKHIAMLSREQCRSNLHSTLILMGWTVEPASGRDFDDYYPGAAYVDVLGWDPYNAIDGSGYQSPDTIFSAPIEVSKAEKKPFAIAETGSLLMGADNGTQRAEWLRDIAVYLRAEGALFVTYYDTVSSRGNDFRLTDVPSREAWRTIVQQ